MIFEEEKNALPRAVLALALAGGLAASAVPALGFAGAPFGAEPAFAEEAVEEAGLDEAAGFEVPGDELSAGETTAETAMEGAEGLPTEADQGLANGTGAGDIATSGEVVPAVTPTTDEPASADEQAPANDPASANDSAQANAPTQAGDPASSDLVDPVSEPLVDETAAPADATAPVAVAEDRVDSEVGGEAGQPETGEGEDIAGAIVDDTAGNVAIVDAADVAAAPSASDAADVEQASSALAADPATSGDWGSCAWDISDAGVLTIHAGSGTDLGTEDAIPWRDARDLIKQVQFEPGVVLPSDIGYMFYGCSALTSLDASGGNASGVTRTASMLRGCTSLESLSLAGWDLSSVASASDRTGMFRDCKELASLDISGMTLPADCTELFASLEGLSTLHATGTNTSNVTSMDKMFAGCISLESIDLTGWNTSSVKSTSLMFVSCRSLASAAMPNWNVSGVEDASMMFAGCTSLTSVDLSGWQPSSLKNAGMMFTGCTAFKSLDLSDWDLSSLTTADNMFAGCSSLETLDLSGWDLSGNPSLNQFIAGCTALKTVDFSNWNTSKLTNVSTLFIGCEKLETVDLSGWDTSSLTDVSSMLNGCKSLRTVDLTGWDTSSMTDVTAMFAGCSSLETLDLSGWDTRSVTHMASAFAGCSSLAEVKLGENFVFQDGAALPSVKVNDHTDWYSTADRKWYTADEIVQLRADESTRVADTYTKTEIWDLAEATVTVAPESYDYTGEEIKPDPKVEVGGETTLAVGTDYTVSYKNNIAVGTATATVTALPGGACIGEKSVTFTIKAADLAKATVTFEPATLTYDSTAQKPKVTVELGGKTLKEGSDYALAWSGGPTFGQLTAKVTGKGSYTGSKVATAWINFTDTPTDAWYQTQGWLDYVVNGGIMTGIKDAKGFTGAFAPEATVTRAQVAVVLFRYANPTSDATSNVAHYGKVSRFRDVPVGQWHTAAIEWCAKEGIVTGYGTTGNFGPDDPVTREQLATMMYRFAKSQGASTSASASTLSKAPDASTVSGWARDAVAWCSANKVITGYAQDGRIDPQGSATRAQLAKIITVVTRDVL